MAGYTPDQILESGDPVLAQSQALSRLTAVEAAAATGAAGVAVNAAAIAVNAGDISDNADAIAALSPTALAITVGPAEGAVSIQVKDSEGADLAAEIPVEIALWKPSFALMTLADATGEAEFTVSTGVEDALNVALGATRKIVTSDATGLIVLAVTNKTGVAATFPIQAINLAGGSSPALAAVAFA